MDKKTRLEIFCGTGGVGKTTLSLTRALYLSKFRNQNIALITIDPAKRLKDLIGLNDDDAGTIVKKQIHNDSPEISLLLMDPEKTFNKIRSQDKPNNRILSLLMKPYGGMNEVMSVVELKQMIDLKIYDVIVLDTPPGSHFIDFLESMEKINDFFDSTWINIFSTLTNKIENQIKSKGFLKELTSSGIKKILGYLENVTGKDFLDEFISAVSEFYQLKNSFLDSIKLRDVFKDPSQCSWFLVTAADQTKITQAQELVAKSREYSNNTINTLVNKTISVVLTDQAVRDSKVAKHFKDFETNLIESLVINEKKPLLFPDILSNDFEEQIKILTNYWDNYND